MKSFGSYPPIIGGDFNSILSPNDTERNFADKKCPALKDLVENFNYTDAYRYICPAGQEYSFSRPNCASSRLDRFYVPPHLVNTVQSVSHHASLGDHKYVVMNLLLFNFDQKLEPPLRKTSYWKLNTSILKDEDLLDNFSELYGNLQNKMP